jgi:hypothetical protein
VFSDEEAAVLELNGNFLFPGFLSDVVDLRQNFTQGGTLAMHNNIGGIVRPVDNSVERH